jgi:hypothetical protein
MRQEGFFSILHVPSYGCVRTISEETHFQRTNQRKRNRTITDFYLGRHLLREQLKSLFGHFLKKLSLATKIATARVAESSMSTYL